MKKIQFIAYGIYYAFMSLWPLVKKFYEDMIVAIAVVTAELEEISKTDNFEAKSRNLGKHRAKKTIAKDILRDSILSPVTKEADKVLGDLVETGWKMLFKTGGR